MNSDELLARIRDVVRGLQPESGSDEATKRDLEAFDRIVKLLNEDAADQKRTQDNAWARIRVDLFDEGPDGKSATRLFDPFVRLVVLLKLKDEPARDVKLVECGYFDELDAYGFSYRLTDADGRTVPNLPTMFVKFEDVQSIGVY